MTTTTLIFFFVVLVIYIMKQTFVGKILSYVLHTLYKATKFTCKMFCYIFMNLGRTYKETYPELFVKYDKFFTRINDTVKKHQAVKSADNVIDFKKAKKKMQKAVK